METLNYHHLRLFWAVAREGNLTRASKKLHLAPQTVSTQIRAFETALGEKLFRRSGRRMLLTDVGHVALRYADELRSPRLSEVLCRVFQLGSRALAVAPFYEGCVIGLGLISPFPQLGSAAGAEYQIEAVRRPL